MKSLIPFTILMAVLLAGTMPLHAAPTIEKPIVLPEAAVSIAAPDLHGLIDGIGGLVSQVSPMMNGMMLKNMIGMQLGDPGLAGIPAGSGLAVVALDQTNLFGVIEVSEAQLGAYTNAVAAKGMAHLYEEGALIIGQTAAQTAKGKELLPAVRSKLLSAEKPVLQIALQPSEVVERNREAIEGLYALMPMMMGMQMQQAPGVDPANMESISNLLEAEVRVLISLAEQTEAMEIILAPTAKGLRVNKTIEPAAGTRLATLLNAPKKNEYNDAVRQGLAQDATIQLECVVQNPEAFSSFLMGETEALMEAMDQTNVLVESFAQLMNDWVANAGGSYAESISFGADEGFSLTYAMDVKDEAEALKQLKTLTDNLKPFYSMYASFGMPMTCSFQENVRQYKGLPIHQFNMKMEGDKLAASQKTQLEAMNLDDFSYHIAITNGLALYAMDEAGIHALIDGLGSTDAGVQLAARERFPAGAGFYGDLDMGDYLLFTFAMAGQTMGDQLKSQLTALMAEVEPVTFAGYRSGGLAQWRLDVPADLIGKIGQASMMIQMQAMQQQMQQGMPQGNPGAVPAP